MAAENHPLLPTYVWGNQEPSVYRWPVTSGQSTSCRQRLQHCLDVFHSALGLCSIQVKSKQKKTKKKKSPTLEAKPKENYSFQCRHYLLCIKIHTLFVKWIQIQITLPHFTQKNFRGWKQLPSVWCTQWGQKACRNTWQLSVMCYQEHVVQCIWLIFWPVDSPPGWCVTHRKGNQTGKQDVPSIQAATSAEHSEFE